MSRSAPVWLAVVLLATGCSKQTSTGRERIAILRFENLTPEKSLDWMGRAVAEQFAVQLGGTARQILSAAQPEVSAQRAAAIASGATHLLHGYVTAAEGRLRLRAELEDVRLKTVRSAEAAGRVEDGILKLTDAVARQIEPSAKSFGTSTESALKAYVEALESKDLAAAQQALSRSIAADPKFQLPHLAAARLSPDPAVRQKAMAELAKVMPNDPTLLRSLSESELKAKNFKAAIEGYKKALELEPGKAELLNELGYVYAYAGDLDSARKTLREYGRLHPDQTNALDSLAEVHFYFGQFREAEQINRQAFEKNPKFLDGATLAKAAHARLMTGDVAGATVIFEEYAKVRMEARDVVIELRRAEWEQAIGKHKEAAERLLNFAQKLEKTSARELSSLAYTQLALWNLIEGERTRAAEYSAKGAAVAGSGGSAALASLVRFLSLPSASAGEWNQRAARMFPQTAQAAIKPAMAYALLLNGHFAEAEPLVRELEKAAPPNPGDLSNVFLAWALVENGKYEEAAPLLERTPVPPVISSSPFAPVVFPRIFLLRSKVAEKKGDRSAADQNLKVYRALGGA